jgi:uncharacterized protein (DUF58 family)
VSAPAQAPGSARGAEARFDEAFLRKLERLSVVAKRVLAGGARGERRTRRTGTGLEFADHRDYVPGDDLRRLDWNLYGRLERPLVRLYDEDEDLSLHLLLDASASMGLGAPPKLALALETGAALAYVGLANLDRVSVHPVRDGLAGGVGPLRGKGQVHAVLGALRAVEAAGRTDLRLAVTQFLARQPRRGVCVLISDFFDPHGAEQALDRLRYGRFDPVVVQIVAPEEARPQLRSDVVVVDVETGEERELTVTPAVQREYVRRFEARQRALDRFCRERAIPCFQVQSTASFEDLVLRLFRVGGLLG